MMNSCISDVYNVLYDSDERDFISVVGGLVSESIGGVGSHFSTNIVSLCTARFFRSHPCMKQADRVLTEGKQTDHLTLLEYLGMLCYGSMLLVKVNHLHT